MLEVNAGARELATRNADLTLVLVKSPILSDLNNHEVFIVTVQSYLQMVVWPYMYMYYYIRSM